MDSLTQSDIDNIQALLSADIHADPYAFWDSPALAQWFAHRGYTLYERAPDDKPGRCYAKPRLPYDDYCEAAYPYAYHDVRGGAELYARTSPLVMYAQDTLGRHVALKIARTGSDEHKVWRFLRARPLGLLREHCVLPVLDVLDLHLHGVCFAVMPRWGHAVYEPRECSTLRDALRIIRARLKGVAFMHAHNIIHRDLKADNVVTNHFGNDADARRAYRARRSLLRGAGAPLEYALIDYSVAIVLPGPAYTCNPRAADYLESVDTHYTPAPNRSEPAPNHSKSAPTQSKSAPTQNKPAPTNKIMLPCEESYIGTPFRIKDTAQGEYEYDPFAFDVGCLGVDFCLEYQHYTPDIPMLAPFLDRLVARDVRRRFTASQALEFLDSVVLPSATEMQLGTPLRVDPARYGGVQYGGARNTTAWFNLFSPARYSCAASYEEYDRWAGLPSEFCRRWAPGYREARGVRVGVRVLRYLHGRLGRMMVVPRVRRVGYRALCILRGMWGMWAWVWAWMVWVWGVNLPLRDSRGRVKAE